MERGLRPTTENGLSREAKEILLRKVVYQISAELSMNQLQEDGFIDHVLTMQNDLRTKEEDFSKESIKSAAEGWMQMRGWRAMYGGDDIDPR